MKNHFFCSFFLLSVLFFYIWHKKIEFTIRSSSSTSHRRGNKIKKKKKKKAMFKIVLFLYPVVVSLFIHWAKKRQRLAFAQYLEEGERERERKKFFLYNQKLRWWWRRKKIFMLTKDVRILFPFEFLPWYNNSNNNEEEDKKNKNRIRSTFDF